MDFNSPFILQCLLVITTVTDGSATMIGALSGSSAKFPLGVENLQNVLKMSWKNSNCSTAVVDDTLLAECHPSSKRCLKLENGSLVLRRVEKEDEGNYEFFFNDTKVLFTLEVFEPIIDARCFPNGTADLTCNVYSNENMTFEWKLNNSWPNANGACVKDGGKKVRLEKTVPGEFVCKVTYNNDFVWTRPIVLSCSYGDLLQYPWFIYILAGCAGAAAILVAVVSSLICCCMRRKHKFIPVPSDEEKDDGITMSVVSSEGVKSPPNGDHVEAQAAQIACPPMPDAARPDSGIVPQPMVEENFPVAVEPGEMPDPEMIADVESQENASNCFPDPIDN
ncbi:B6.1 precursor [Gallus gallus]|uniref:Ig-like domain-containing protein n=1 Tax=Gallus gallus TaxID=9031 RepID=A0A8V0XX87_CHICK|nr:B6.1 precursor [Gallus gallus]